MRVHYKVAVKRLFKCLLQAQCFFIHFHLHVTSMVLREHMLDGVHSQVIVTTDYTHSNAGMEEN